MIFTPQSLLTLCSLWLKLNFCELFWYLRNSWVEKASKKFIIFHSEYFLDLQNFQPCPQKKRRKKTKITKIFSTWLVFVFFIIYSIFNFLKNLFFSFIVRRYNAKRIREKETKTARSVFERFWRRRQQQQQWLSNGSRSVLQKY